jgi:hypothetical protein
MSLLADNDILLKIKIWFGISVEPEEKKNTNLNTKSIIIKKLLDRKSQLSKNEINKISSDLLSQRISKKKSIQKVNILELLP